MKLFARAIAFAAAAAFTAGVSFAQTANHTQTPQHHGLMSLLHRPKPATAHKPLFAGNIIGNKRTHVFHMPGDPGALPAPQNRVYFRTQAQAIAAGYHRVGSNGHAMHKAMAHKPMAHHM